MGFLFKVLSAIVLSTVAGAAAAQTRVAEPADLVFVRAGSEIALKTQVFQTLLGDEDFDWAVDLEAGTIAFTSASRVISAPVQVIGTFNTLDQTFLWGWDHPSVSEPLAAAARLAREFGERQDLPLFTTRKVECTEDEAWGFTAVALYLSGGQGAYRGPTGTTMVFMTFGDVTITPIDRR